MSQEETPDDGGGGILAGLLAPLRLPERTLEALDTLVEAVENLGPMRSELTRVREQTAPLGELLPALEHLEERLGTRLDSIHEVVAALENEESHLNATVADLAREIGAMHKTLSGLQDDVQSVTNRLPDASRGPLEKARDVLSGGPAQEG
jgi:predicted nuclease with TOPRIM domain